MKRKSVGLALEQRLTILRFFSSFM